MPTLTICVTVDWEGMNLEQKNLQAMTDFRQAFPQIPLTHFICPAYFTRGFDAGPMEKLIAGQLQTGDEVALHVHCWKSLVTAAGVNFKDKPCWYTDGIGPEEKYYDGSTDYGHGVPFGAYSKADVSRIIKTAGGLLEKHLNQKPSGFRCGGWMSATSVQEALQAEKVEYDSSGADAPYFKYIAHKLKDNGGLLGEWLPKLWGDKIEKEDYLANALTHAAYPKGLDSVSEPREITVHSGKVYQVPDNGVLADYLDQHQMLDRLKAAWVEAEKKDFVHICGFHQESATWESIWTGINIKNITDALAEFLKFVKSKSPEVKFNTVCGLKKGLPGVNATYHPSASREIAGRQESASARTRFWG